MANLASKKVLVIEDQPDIVRLVRSCLELEGFEVTHVGDGAAAMQAIQRLEPDVVVLDIMLPNMDGLQICREIRVDRTTPILMISARDEDIDKILGLEIGADDYLTKPFNPAELVARVRAMLRRRAMDGAQHTLAKEEVLACGSLKIHPAAQRVVLQGKEVPLTPIEFSLLKTLVAEAGNVVTRETLLKEVWGPAYTGEDSVMNFHIQNLRLKLQRAAPGPHYVTSVWGTGYRFDF